MTDSAKCNSRKDSVLHLMLIAFKTEFDCLKKKRKKEKEKKEKKRGDYATVSKAIAEKEVLTGLHTAPSQMLSTLH